MNKVIVIAAVIFFMNFAPRVFANQIVPGGQLEAMAVTEVENLLAAKGETRRREITLLRSLADINLPNGVIDIKISVPSAMVNYTGVTPVKARIFVGGRIYRDVNFVVVVKVFDFALVANHDLRIETPVTEADFRLDEISVDGRTEYIQDAQEIVGLVPHRVIRAGSPISANYFQQPVAVSSNSPVRIIVRYKGIEASAKGITLTRGRIGEIIKVKNETSKKVLSAKVIDSGTVEVIM
ncbi:MAG: flagellar basal body P-ring formation protein FlgA [Selenomonadaceae bacterium]|nr:flagellar basal body P-ring formation protein FlgA [Selenomonadaceae bacterium]